jgi:hypothetical protein
MGASLEVQHQLRVICEAARSEDHSLPRFDGPKKVSIANGLASCDLASLVADQTNYPVPQK